MKTPSLNRINAVLIFCIALVVIMHFARPFLIPLTIGIILSTLVLPVCKKLERWGWGRGWAILVCLFLILVAGAIFITVMTAPISSFNEDLPALESSLDEKLAQIQLFFSQKLNISIHKQNSLMEQASEALSSAGNYLAGFVTGFFGFVFDSILVLVYVSFFLFYREQYETFVVKLNDDNDPEDVRKVLRQVSRVSTQYLIGRMLSILI